MSAFIRDRIYQRMLRYEHHHENYKNSLLNNITPYGLQLTKKAQTETISEVSQLNGKMFYTMQSRGWHSF